MPLRMAITKVSGQGEQIVVDVCQWNPVTGDIVHNDIAELSALFNEALAFVDVRLFEMNVRMLESYDMRKYFDAENWQKISQILEILAGRVDPKQVIQRWEATIEENNDLAAMREAAHIHSNKVEYVNGDYDNEYESDPSILKILEQNRIQDKADEAATRVILTTAEQDQLRAACAEMGCTCAHDHQHNCPVHCDNGRGV